MKKARFTEAQIVGIPQGTRWWNAGERAGPQALHSCQYDSALALSIRRPPNQLTSFGSYNSRSRTRKCDASSPVKPLRSMPSRKLISKNGGGPRSATKRRSVAIQGPEVPRLRNRAPTSCRAREFNVIRALSPDSQLRNHAFDTGRSACRFNYGAFDRT